MRPIRAVHHVGTVHNQRREDVTVLAFLPGGEQFPPMAIIMDENGRLSHCDVTALTIEEHQRMELGWISGWQS